MLSEDGVQDPPHLQAKILPQVKLFSLSVGLTIWAKLKVNRLNALTTREVSSVKLQ